MPFVRESEGQRRPCFTDRSRQLPKEPRLTVAFEVLHVGRLPLPIVLHDVRRLTAAEVWVLVLTDDSGDRVAPAPAVVSVLGQVRSGRR